MHFLLILIAVLLIALGLLQSGKAEGASRVISGGSADLFSNRKERGPELFVSRLTMGLGIAFFILSFWLSK